jgi:hypothetical protein
MDRHRCSPVAFHFAFCCAISDALVLDAHDVGYPEQNRSLTELERLDSESLQAPLRSYAMTMPARPELIEIEKWRFFFLQIKIRSHA